MEIVDVEETESENPMGWFYMVYTARRDVVEVEYQKGYDTLTIGDPVGGFYPKKTESWNRLNEGEIAVYHLTDEIYFEDVVYGNVMLFDGLILIWGR